MTRRPGSGDASQIRAGPWQAASASTAARVCTPPAGTRRRAPADFRRARPLSESCNPVSSESLDAGRAGGLRLEAPSGPPRRGPRPVGLAVATGMRSAGSTLGRLIGSNSGTNSGSEVHGAHPGEWSASVRRPPRCGRSGATRSRRAPTSRAAGGTHSRGQLQGCSQCAARAPATNEENEGPGQRPGPSSFVTQWNGIGQAFEGARPGTVAVHGSRCVTSNLSRHPAGTDVR